MFQKFFSSFLSGPRSSRPLFDEEELQTEAVQRAWQYLQQYNEDPKLIQHFNFDANQKREDSPEECLETLIGFVIYNLFYLFYAAVVLLRVTRPGKTQSRAIMRHLSERVCLSICIVIHCTFEDIIRTNM